MLRGKGSLVLAAVVILGWAACAGADTYPTPIALYHFDGDGVDTIDGSTATLYEWAGYTTSEKQVGTGCLDTTNGYWAHATVPEGSTINGTNNWSISFWFKRTGTYEWGAAFSFGDGKFWLEYNKAEWPYKWTNLSSGYGTFWGCFNITSDPEWEFFAFTADGSTFRAYRGYNGVLTQGINDTIGAGEVLNGSSEMLLGFGRWPADPHWNCNDLDGYMDELAVWNAGMTADQITEIFNAGAAGQNLVPEPATLCLLAAGGLLSVLRKRR